MYRYPIEAKLVTYFRVYCLTGIEPFFSEVASLVLQLYKEYNSFLSASLGILGKFWGQLFYQNNSEWLPL